jgi:tetratricopeptide (TPR) repeat protein
MSRGSPGGGLSAAVLIGAAAVPRPRAARIPPSRVICLERQHRSLREDRLIQVRAELGYVDFLRGRYDRAELWLTDALKLADGSPSVQAKALTYLGALESDRASYRRATGLLEQAVTLSQAAGEPRREAYGLSMLGRVRLFRGDLDVATEQFDASIKLAERDHWLAGPAGRSGAPVPGGRRVAGRRLRHVVAGPAAVAVPVPRGWSYRGE